MKIYISKSILILLSTCAFSIGSLLSQSLKELPKSFTEGKRSLNDIQLQRMLEIDTSRLLFQDSINESIAIEATPFRFAFDIDVNFSSQNSGTWETLPDGSRIWRLRILSKNAKSLNFGFSKFELPEGAKVWLYDNDGLLIHGPYISNHRAINGEFWTPLIEGNEAIIELFVPSGASPEPLLELKKVNHGYKSVGKAPNGEKGGDKGAQGTCNIDIICPAGNPWSDQSRSVAWYTINGTGTCSGQLVNNTTNDFTPYLLTAFHCDVSAANAPSMVVYWNFESSNCGDHSGGSLSENQSGAIFRADWADSDFALVELQQLPDPTHNVYYSGWDASGTASSSSVAIHHPRLGEKSISFDNNSVSSTSYFGTTSDATEDHWRIGAWDAGTTERGSSGSGLWDANTGLCIGQLHGGLASCAALGDSDWYGKLSSSWLGGGTVDSRLRDWLNPANDGTVSLVGAEPLIPGGPVMRLQSTILDYDEVELGFASTKGIVIYNDGDANLVVSVNNISASNPDIDQFTVELATNETVLPGGAPLILPQIYEPDNLSSHDIDLSITSNDPAIPVQNIHFMGTGRNPIPIHSVLVLDRSGSMDDVAGARTKINAMADAASLYIDLLRPDIGGTGTGDKIGFTKYNNTNSIYLPLDFVDDPLIAGSHSSDAQEKLNNSALTNMSQLKPDGATGIGGAMQTAAGMYDTPDGVSKHVMVVLTDGIENRSPYIGTVTDPIQSSNLSLNMYSIGLGSNIEPNKLQMITNVGNGYHQVSDDLSGASLFDLESFYFKIFANATGWDLIVDPTYVVPIINDEPIVVATAIITSSDRTATFVVLDIEEYRGIYNLEIVTPNGQVINQGTLVGGIAVQTAKRKNHTIYKVILPDANEVTSEFLGAWKLQLTPKAVDIQIVKSIKAKAFSTQINPQKGYVPVGFAAAVSSNYKMKVNLLPGSYNPGTSVLMTAHLTDRGWPSLSGRVTTNVTTPDGSFYTRELFDDGSHGDAIAEDGIWSGYFTQTGGTGSYRFLFRGTGRNFRGELAPREATRYLTLGTPAINPPDNFTGTRKPTSFSIHTGITIPDRDFDKPNNWGYMVELDLEYSLRDRWSLEIVGGQYAFDTDNRIYGLTAYIKGYHPYGLWRPYVALGPGYYKLESATSSEFGYSLGIGLNRSLHSKLNIEFGTHYFSFSRENRSSFVTFKSGLKFKF